MPYTLALLAVALFCALPVVLALIAVTHLAVGGAHAVHFLTHTKRNGGAV